MAAARMIRPHPLRLSEFATTSTISPVVAAVNPRPMPPHTVRISGISKP